MKHLEISIFGNVQGVFFRARAKEKADEIGLCGFVRNKSDGSVYIEVEGKESCIDEFLAWCRKGPKAAKVERVEVIGGQVKKFEGFSIL